MVSQSVHTPPARRGLNNLPESVPQNAGSPASKLPLFVIQKHESKKLHYDLHLEIDGVLKSWAIPQKAFSRYYEKQPAIPNDDHPVEYAAFEGVIPKHQYGSGTVMIWDRGTYQNLMIKDGRPLPNQTCYKHGQLEVYLHGSKIRGRYILIRSERNEIEQEWLLIRKDDAVTVQDLTAREEDTSILTGRTMSQIRQEWRKE